MPNAVLVFTVRPLRRPDISVPMVQTPTMPVPTLVKPPPWHGCFMLRVVFGCYGICMDWKFSCPPLHVRSANPKAHVAVTGLAQDLSMTLSTLQQHAEQATGVPICQQTIWILGALEAMDPLRHCSYCSGTLLPVYAS